MHSSFVVAEHQSIPAILSTLGKVAEFEVVRCKNRLARSYDSADSAGYRDVQLLVKTAAGWIVELQIIPSEIYQLKNSLGHQDYMKYRLIVEAGKRSRSAAGAKSAPNDHQIRRDARKGSTYTGFEGVANDTPSATISDDEVDYFMSHDPARIA